MRKVITIALVSVLLIALGGVTFAGAFDSPAEIYARLTGRTIEEAYEARKAGQTFGQLAEEEGVLEEFRAANLEIKKAILQERVEEGIITQEEADEILKAIEEGCTLEPGSKRLGQKYGLGFGSGRGQGCGGRGFGRGQGQGLRQGFGRNN